MIKEKSFIKFIILSFCSIILVGLIYFQMLPLQNDESWVKNKCSFTKLNDKLTLFYTKNCYKIFQISNPINKDCWIKLKNNNCEMVFTQPIREHLFISILLYIFIFFTAFYFSEMTHP